MALKPIDKRRPDEKRQATWDAVRELKTFLVTDVWYKTRLSKASIQDYLQGLAAAGYLSVKRVKGQGCAFKNEYTLVRNVGMEAPRVRRDGTEVTQGRNREQMWRTMRILGEFSARDLAVNASTEKCKIAESDAKDYCHYLHKAGYLAVSHPGHGTGSGGILTRYRFIAARFTGPKPPMIQRVKAVYDPNLGQVVWSSQEEVTRDNK